MPHWAGRLIRLIAHKPVHPSEAVTAASGASDTLFFREAACGGWGTAANNTGDTILKLRSGSGSEPAARHGLAVDPALHGTALLSELKGSRSLPVRLPGGLVEPFPYR